MAELDRVNDFLRRHDAMVVTMLDGHLAAVASGPNLVMPDQMLRWIWDTENGEKAPEFKDQTEASEIVGLILRHYQAVNDALNDRVYVPRIVNRDVEACRRISPGPGLW
jgi:yecA family protein